MPNFDDLLSACLERDAHALALCTEAGLSVNRRDHERNPLWFLIMSGADRQAGHDQRVKDCMAVLWSQGLRLDKETSKGYSLPNYLATKGDPALAVFLLSLPRGVERFSKHLEKYENPITRQWWVERLTEAQAQHLSDSTPHTPVRPKGPRL